MSGRKLTQKRNIFNMKDHAVMTGYIVNVICNYSCAMILAHLSMVMHKWWLRRPISWGSWMESFTLNAMNPRCWRPGRYTLQWTGGHRWGTRYRVVCVTCEGIPDPSCGDKLVKCFSVKSIHLGTSVHLFGRVFAAWSFQHVWKVWRRGFLHYLLE